MRRIHQHNSGYGVYSLDPNDRPWLLAATISGFDDDDVNTRLIVEEEWTSLRNTRMNRDLNDIQNRASQVINRLTADKDVSRLIITFYLR